MSEFNDVIKYLADNLHIDIEQQHMFGPVETIKVQLRIGDKVISEDYCDLPTDE